MKKIDKNCGIYQIRNILTKFCYTGQSIDLKDRERHHWGKLKNNKHKNSHLQNSYNKHGREFFIFEILIYCLPEELTYYEQLFCDVDKAHGLSYNIRECVNSNKGTKRTDKTKRKIALAASNISKETREKMSKAQIERLKNNPHPMQGKTHSPKTIELLRKKCGRKGKDNPKTIKKGVVLAIINAMDNKVCLKEIAETLKISYWTVLRVRSGYYDEMYGLVPRKWARITLCGKNHYLYGTHPSLESVKKMSKAQSGKNHHMWGKHHSEETIEKMKIAAKGENNPMFGKHHTDEAKEKIGESHKGKTHSLKSIEKIRKAKLTSKEKVLEVLMLLESGISVTNIIKQLGISRGVVYKAKNGFYNNIYDLKT